MVKTQNPPANLLSFWLPPVKGLYVVAGFYLLYQLSVRNKRPSGE